MATYPEAASINEFLSSAWVDPSQASHLIRCFEIDLKFRFSKWPPRNRDFETRARIVVLQRYTHLGLRLADH